MPVKTVTLSEDAYVALAALKKDGESFSDVVRRLARGSRSLLEFAGDWKDFPEEKMTAYLSFLKAGDRLSKAKVRRELGAAGSEWTGQGRGVVARRSLEQRPTAVARTHALETSGEPKCVTAPMAAKTLIGAALRGGRAASHSGPSLRANPGPYRKDILASNRAPWRKGNMH